MYHKEKIPISQSMHFLALVLHRKDANNQVKYLLSVINLKLKNCKNTSKVKDMLVFIEKMKNDFNLAAEQVQKLEITINPPLTKSIALEILRTNKYESATEKGLLDQITKNSKLDL